MSYLFYTSCFHQKQYVDIVVNLLNSFFDTNSNIDFLVYTTTEFRALIEEKLPGKPVKFFEKNFVKTMNQARISKIDIFDYPEIAKYDKIIYIDSDSMFLKNPVSLFEAITDDVIYACGEGNILNDGNYWGKSLFLKNDTNCVDQEGISVACLGFKNNPEFKKLFSKIKQAFYLDMYQNKLLFYDQPFFNLFLINNQMVNKTDYKNLILSRPSPEEALSKGLVAVHFAGCPGHSQIKLDLFADFKSKYAWPQPEVLVESVPEVQPEVVVESLPEVQADSLLDSLQESVVDSLPESLPEVVANPNNIIDEANLIAYIRSLNPNYIFDERTKRRNLFAASISSKTVCFLGGDTALPAAIVANNNQDVQVTIVESVNKNTTSIDHRVNSRVEIANIDTILIEKRKYDTIICDDITSLERTILTAMRISNPGSTIIMNGIEKPEVAAIWNKYVDMLELQLCSSVQYTDTETQSVRVIL